MLLDLNALVEVDARASNVPFGRRSLEYDLSLKAAKVTGAFVADVLVGFLIVHRFDDEAHIINLVVLPEFRRQGTARLLLDDLLSTSVRDVFLEVRETNTAAISLYLSAGFELTGIRKEYYSNPNEDAILMKWQRKSA